MTTNKTGLNFYRILKFAILLFLFRAILGAAVGFFWANDESILVQYFVDIAAVILVFVRLAAVQKVALPIHVALVFVLQEALNIIFFAIAFGRGYFTEISLLDYLLLVIAALVGALIGTRLRKRETGAKQDGIKRDGVSHP